MASGWIDHVKKVAKAKKISYSEALKVAGKTWKGSAAAPKKGKAKKDDTHKMPDGKTMSGKKHSKDSKEVKKGKK